MIGESETKRTKFEAEVEGIDGKLEKAELIIDDERLVFVSDVNSSILFDSKNGVFTMILESKSQKKKIFPNSNF